MGGSVHGKLLVSHNQMVKPLVFMGDIRGHEMM